MIWCLDFQLFAFTKASHVFRTFISFQFAPCHHQAPPPPEGHLAIYHLPHPVCPRSRWILIWMDQGNRGPGPKILQGDHHQTSPEKKKKHMLCISTCWRCKVPLILVHKDMNEKSPLVIVIARICILDHETLSSRVHYCNGDHVLIKILLIRKPSMLTIHVNFKIYIYMLIKTIHVNLLLQLVRALDTLQLTHHSRLSRQKLNLRNQDPTVRKGCSLRSLPIFGWKSYTPFSGFNFKHVESYSSQLSIKCIYLQSYSKVEEWWRLLLVNPPISTDVPPKHWHHVTTPSSWVPWCKGTILRSN